MKITIEVTPQKTDTDPRITIFNVLISRGIAEWPDTFGSKELTESFLRGVRAAAAILAEIHPSMPLVSENEVTSEEFSF